MTSSLEKSLYMLRDVQARLTNALTIQQKSVDEVVVQIRDVKIKPKQQSSYQKSGRSQIASGKMSGRYNASSRLKTYESEAKSTAMQQLKAQNKELKKYIHLLQKINDNLRTEVHKLMKKTEYSHSIPKDINVFYDSDHFTLMKSELESLRRMNSAQSYELMQLKSNQYSTIQPKDLYQYVSPAKVRQQRSKLLSKTEASIPEYNGYCDCDSHWKTVSKSRLEKQKMHKRSNTQYRPASTIKYHDSHGKIGTISKKKKSVRTKE